MKQLCVYTGDTLLNEMNSADDKDSEMLAKLGLRAPDAPPLAGKGTLS